MDTKVSRNTELAPSVRNKTCKMYPIIIFPEIVRNIPGGNVVVHKYLVLQDFGCGGSE